MADKRITRSSSIRLVQDSPFDRGTYLRDWRRWRKDASGDIALRVAVVTGANGFLGAHLVRALLQHGVTVRALVRPGANVQVLTGLDVDIRQGDLTDAVFLRSALKDADVLFHLAAVYSQDPRDIGLMYQVNTGLVRVLIRWAWEWGVSRIVHTSTIGTIGRRSDGRPPDERVPFNLWAEASHYVRSKHLGEIVALTWAQMGAPVVVVNPTAPIGAYDWRPTPTGRRVLAVLRGEIPPYPPGGMNVVPARDVAAGMILAALQGIPGTRYILGHREGNLTLAQFIAQVARAANMPPPQVLSPSLWQRWRARWWRWRRGHAQGGPQALTADPRRAVEELGMPQSDLAAAFEEAVTWYRQQEMFTGA